MLVMHSWRTNRPVANQYVTVYKGSLYFVSYASVCAKYDVANNTLTLGRDWDYSRTTTKYLAIFIDENTPFKYVSTEGIRRKIKNGEFLYDEKMLNTNMFFG